MTKALFAIVVAAVSMGVATRAQAQISHADLCAMESVGLTAGMKTAVRLNQPAAVALQQAGLKPGGPRHSLATQAYARLKSGVAEAAVVDEVRAACLKANYRALLDDKPTFDDAADGAGAQLCSDLATSLSGFLAGDPQAAAMKLDDALDSYAPREHSDNPAPRPRLSTAMQLTQQFARANPEAEKISAFAMRHCQSLDDRARSELDREFYAQ